MKKVKAIYIEPEDYFPEEIQKKFKIGKYADDTEFDEFLKKDGKEDYQVVLNDDSDSTSNGK